MERRQFLGWVGVGMLASSFPFVLAACNAEEDETSTSTSTPNPESEPTIDTSVREDGFQVVGTVAELETDGSL